MVFVAIPAVIIVGLINKSERKKRLKELGEIRVHLKDNPDKWKRVMYYILFLVFVTIIVIIAYWLMIKIVFPIAELNEVSKQLLQNSTNKSG